MSSPTVHRRGERRLMALIQFDNVDNKEAIKCEVRAHAFSQKCKVHLCLMKIL